MRCASHDDVVEMGRAVRARSIMALRQEHGERDHHPVCSRAEYDEVRDQLRVVQEENCKLQAIITDVTAVNKRWQKYNNDRQMYVQGLLATIQELQEHVNTMVGQQVFSSKDSGLEKGRSALLREQVEALQLKLDTLEKQHREHTQVLELQVKSYRDDWEAEHQEKHAAVQDKQQAERRACELELELRCLRRKLESRCGLEADKHCECCRLSRESTYVNGLTGRTYRTSAQLPTALENFQSYNDDLEIDGNKQGLKTGSCSVSSMSLSTAGSDISEVCDWSRSQQSGVRQPHLGSSTDGASKMNEPVRDSVTMLNVVHQVPRGDRSSSGVTIGFTSDGRAAVTSFANFPVAKSSSLPVERESEQVAASVSTSASDDVGRLTSWLPSLDIATPPRPVEVPERDACSSKPAGRRRKANYYEEGVATQTEDDIICPGCGHVFPPKHQLDFLDHFELCQSK